MIQGTAIPNLTAQDCQPDLSCNADLNLWVPLGAAVNEMLSQSYEGKNHVRGWTEPETKTFPVGHSWDREKFLNLDYDNPFLFTLP